MQIQRTPPASPAVAVQPTAGPPPPRAAVAQQPPGGQAVEHVTTPRVLEGVRIRDRAYNHVRPARLEIREGVLQSEGPRLAQNYWTDAAGVHGDDEANPRGRHVETAGCAQTTAAVVMHRFGHFATEEGADEHLRVPIGLGGPLLGLVEYYRMRGLSAGQRHGGSWSELRNALEQGFGVAVTIRHSNSPHTMSVTGMLTGTDGTEYIRLQDVDGGGAVLMTRAEFEVQWQELQLGGLGGLHTGIGRAYVVVGEPGSKLPPGGSTWGELNALSSQFVLEGFDDVTGAVRYFGEGEVLGGAARMLEGTIQLAAAAPAAVVQGVGAGVEWVGERASKWARGVLASEDSGFLAKAGAAVVAALAFVLEALGSLVRHCGQLGGAVTGMLARAVASPLGALADWAHKDNDAANNLRHADPAGSPREQKYWELLLATPVVPGKTYLLDALLEGRVSEDERRMVLRLFASCEPGDLRALLADPRVERAFAGTSEENAWRAEVARANPPASEERIQTAPRVNVTAPAVALAPRT